VEAKSPFQVTPVARGFLALAQKNALRGPEELVELREPARNILHTTMAREASISNCEREKALRKRERPGEPGL
jgi:hypothetical protein